MHDISEVLHMWQHNQQINLKNYKKLVKHLKNCISRNLLWIGLKQCWNVMNENNQVIYKKVYPG